MASLYVLKGATPGQRLTLNGDTFVLGRSPGSDLVIPATSVSRQHARIVRIQGRFYVEDMQSRNGTRLNDQAIKVRVPLKDGDRLQICDFVASFHERAERPPGPPSTAPHVPIASPEAGTESSTSIRAKIEQSSGLYKEIQSAEKLKVILGASNAFRKSLELDQLVPRVADTIFELFSQADRCFIVFRDEPTGRLQPVCAKTRRPQDEASARFSETLIRHCLESRQPKLDNDDPPLPDSSSIIDLRARSVLCAPLCTAEGEAFGAIQLDTQNQAKKFAKEDLDLLTGLADQAAIALENARLHEDLLAREQLEVLIEQATQVQVSMLPAFLPEVLGYEFYAHWAPALGVSGDYYDFIPLPQGRLAVAIGDVAGKGMPAALLMTKVCCDMRYCLLAEAELAAAVIRLNELLYPNTHTTDRFVTLAAAVLDPTEHTVTLVNAGHLAPLLYRRAGNTLVEPLPYSGSGAPLGLEKSRTYRACRIELQPGDSLLLFTDGVPDARDVHDAPFHLRGIHAAVKEGGSFAPRGLGERILKAVERHAAGHSPHDDITLVCFGRTGN